MSMELVFKQVSFNAEVASFSAAGSGVTAENSLSHGAEELPTFAGYVSQHERIVGLLLLYKALIQKDASDLTEMGAMLNEFDSMLSNTFTK